ncbi:hypothetical protein So717_07860 [Roseobacter cerasinus]|uniref:Uncharacterized protein n=1 Tax=Roseobacter cerasinus TaxID=2602289 RepID=A0A640VL63_9RHOB|nr:hypothetical protein [Roseobacter cerasinus]GFE49033.1 hypothetical protein So717_07860 [Roseobacter cerasinus]
MAKKDVGNTPSDAIDEPMVDDTGDMEFDALFDDISEEFGVVAEADSGGYDALNAALVGTEFEAPATESGGTARLFDIADGAVTESGAADEAEVFGFIKRRFKKRALQAMRALIRKVRSARKYAKCIPQLLKVIAAVKAKRWGTAIKEALATWRCIRRA